MLAEFIIVAAQSCQNGQCPTTKESSVVATVKDSLTVATTVTVINGPQTPPVVVLTTSPVIPRIRLPKLFQRPNAATCCGGKCK